MIRKILIMTMMALSLTARAQNANMGHHDMVHLTTNLLYDAALVPNVGVEYAFAPKWSAKAHGMYAWWSDDSRHRYWRVAGGSVEVRRWLGSKVNTFLLKGHHVGVYAGAYKYDFELGGTGNMADFNYSAGVSYGYSAPIGRKLSLDMGLSVGYIGGEYTKYDHEDGCYVWLGDMKRNYVGVTRAEVSLVWHIELGRKGGR